MKHREKCIGFFDSGLGGISVLREAIRLIPNENYIYFGDSKNAPYGIKTVEEIRDLTFKAVRFLLDREVKAVVIACNTATSAAINELRAEYTTIPIVGIEPAVKPAISLRNQGSILIMATPVTLEQKKFKDLYDQYKSDTKIKPLPCPELVEFVERGEIEGHRLREYLEKQLSICKVEEIGAIVLGCTHFPFVEKVIEDIVGPNIPIIHGGYGTARQLKRLLEERHIENKNKCKGNITMYNSLENEEILKLSKELLFF